MFRELFPTRVPDDVTEVTESPSVPYLSRPTFHKVPTTTLLRLDGGFQLVYGFSFSSVRTLSLVPSHHSFTYLVRISGKMNNCCVPELVRLNPTKNCLSGKV